MLERQIKRVRWEPGDRMILAALRERLPRSAYFRIRGELHLATRRVVAAACTAEPNSAWVTQQARNLSWKLSDEGISVRVVAHDRDRKFARSFDAFFEGEGARAILTPLTAPRAKAHAERWVGVLGANAWTGC